jgi:aminopeptidase N
MWIHEGWTTYMEELYVEHRWGKADGLRYINGLKPKVKNATPVITRHGVNEEPPEDQYYKGALMINTLRSVVDDDAKWFADIHDFYQHFKYQNIMTEDVVAWWSERTGMDLKPFFDEYLRHAALPVLELKFNAATKSVEYRWKAEEKDFSMPIEVGDPQHWTLVTPVTAEWKTMPWKRPEDEFKVATDLYYVDVGRERQ